MLDSAPDEVRLADVQKRLQRQAVQKAVGCSQDGISPFLPQAYSETAGGEDMENSHFQGILSDPSMVLK